MNALQPSDNAFLKPKEEFENSTASNREEPSRKPFSYRTVVKEEFIIEYEDDSPDDDDDDDELGDDAEPEDSFEEGPNKDRRRKFKSLHCDECDKTFSKHDSFYTHINRHRNLNARKYVCEPCHKPFASRFELTKHERTFHRMHHREDFHPHEMNIVDQPNVPKMVVERDAEGLFVCSQCEKKFEQRCQFTRHFKKHFAKQQALFQCDMCERCFGSRTDLANHQLTHVKKETAMSDYTTVKQRPSINVMEEDGVFKCSGCGKAFLERFLCVRHIWRHNLNKPDFFECGTCQKQFNKRSNLARHESMHEREKTAPPKCRKPPKFHCEKCKRPFWKQWNLNRHQLIHDKEEATLRGQTIEAYLTS